MSRRVLVVEALRAGRPVDLLPRQAKLLEYLLRNRGRVATRAALLEKVAAREAQSGGPTLSRPLRAPRGRTLVLALAGAVLSACAHYSPLPLAEQPILAPALSIPPQRPLTIAEVAALAVDNDPDLRAVRAQHGVAQAQLVQAGVLPNPTFGFAILPLLAGAGTMTAWNAALSFDIKALVTLRARKDAAEQTVRQVDAQILWQEWQVAGQARLLAVDLIEGRRNLALLTETRDLFADRVRRVQAAVTAGDLTLAVAAPYVAALQAAQVQLDDQAGRLLAQQHQLNALLGLAPEATVPLADTVDLPPLDPAAIEAGLPGLAQRRPDLVALQLGYRAQDAKVRAAILGQFPNLSLGLTTSTDNAGVRNGGPQVSMGLPIFDRNQGVIAIEEATRVQLHEEYTARLTAAHGLVRAMLSERAQLAEKLRRALSELPAAEDAARKAAAAAATGDLDNRALVDLLNIRLSRAQQVVAFEQTLAEQHVALATLVGAGLPPIQLPPQEAAR